MEQALKAATKGVEIIMLGDLNVRLRYLCDEREEYLAMTFADRGLVDITDHFMP